MKALENIQEIRNFFKKNTTPIYFFGVSCFHLMGIERWVSKFKFITYIDSFDGQCEHVFSPKNKEVLINLHDIEEVNNYLLSHPEVIDYINNNGGSGNSNGKVLFLMFNKYTEILAKKLNLEILYPSFELISFLDNNLYTNMIAEKAEVPFKPQILTKVNSYKHLLPLTSSLGTDLAIQTPFGYAGHNTFLVSNKEDYNKYAAEIEREKIVKITRRESSYINTAIEACVTNQGTLTAPLMIDLTGFEELTPHKSGWCGNEIYPHSFNHQIREKAKNYTVIFGNLLWKEGYRGYFELDFLVDSEDNEIYFNELNPRISGLSNLTNNSKFTNIDVPLFLFHLLEWMDIPFNIDINSLNNNWLTDDYVGEWTQVIIKHTLDTKELITDVPVSGIWKMKIDGSIAFISDATNQNEIKDENQAYFLNIIQPENYMYRGLNLGVLFVKNSFINDQHQLTKHAKRWINAIRSLYRSDVIDYNDKTFEVEEKRLKKI
jgi:hypothetical protein